MKRKEFLSFSEEDTANIAKKFCNNLKVGDAVLFHGEMGAGKTTFTKTIAEYYNCDDIAVSPTFSLVNEYFGDSKIFHFDLYRISDEEDLYSIGFYDYIREEAIFVIEWSENIPSLSDEFSRVFTISITKIDEASRKIIIEGMEE